MIETCTCWESDASVETILLNEPSVALLDPVGDIHDFHAWFDEALGIFSCLTMNLSGTSQLFIVRLKQSLLGSQFSTANSVLVALSRVFLDLTKWEVAIGELLRDRNSILGVLLPVTSIPASKQSE